MTKPDKPKPSDLPAYLSPNNSIGATIQLVLGVSILCAVFSTFFWWIRS
jgi:hypothetical protein